MSSLLKWSLVAASIASASSLLGGEASRTASALAVTQGGAAFTSADNQVSSGTFQLVGRGAQGTVVLLRLGQEGRAVLVTAAHVLRAMRGETAFLRLHQTSRDHFAGTQSEPIRIRYERCPFWTQHPSADIAILEVTTPPSLWRRLPAVDLLASSAVLAGQAQGRPVHVAGFPSDARAGRDGLPVLRTGALTTPVFPSVNWFTVSVSVCPGLSGAPVYAAAPGLSGGDVLLGIVSLAMVRTDEPESPARLAVVVPAPLVVETIALLPALSAGRLTSHPAGLD